MPRAKLQREPCDCADCKEGGAPPPPSGAAAAMARQLPPPRSLVLCLGGVLQPAVSLRDAELPHLHAAVRAGWAGLLASRAGGPALPMQLLGLSAPEVAPQLGLPERFKQLRAVLLTDSQAVAKAGRLVDCYAVHLLDSWPSPAQLAARIAKLLHVQPWSPDGPAAADAGAATTLPALAAVLAAAGSVDAPAAAEVAEEGDDVIDMLLVAVDAASLPMQEHQQDASLNGSTAAAKGAAGRGAASGGGSSSSSSSSKASDALEWADSLLSHLNQVPGFRDTVLLSVIAGPGEQPLGMQPLNQDQPLLVHSGAQQAATPAATASCQGAAAAAAGAGAECPPVRRPMQSYQFAGQQQVEVDALRPAVVVHRLAGVIRVDRATALDLAEVREKGAAGCILAERLLPEVAYKLGRAPKYGA